MICNLCVIKLAIYPGGGGGGVSNRGRSPELQRRQQRNRVRNHLPKFLSPKVKCHSETSSLLMLSEYEYTIRIMLERNRFLSDIWVQF